MAQCITNRDIKPVENLWKIESVAFFRSGDIKDPQSLLTTEFNLYRPFMDSCPPELKAMEPRDCRWALSNAGVHCSKQQVFLDGKPVGRMAPHQEWFNCTGRVTMLLPGKWMKDDPEQAWLKWRVIKLDELPSAPQNITILPFRSITIEVVYGQR
jgi:hypothetical protein